MTVSDWTGLGGRARGDLVGGNRSLGLSLHLHLFFYF